MCFFGLVFLSSLFFSSLDALANNLTLTHPKQLTVHTAKDLLPRVSIDGKLLVFSSNRAGNWDIWARSLSSTSKISTQVTRHTAFDSEPSLSPDGRWVAFTSRRLDAYGDIWVKEVFGGKIHRLTNYKGLDCEPCFSPDGRKIAFVSDRRNGCKNIFLYDLKTQIITQVTTRGGCNPTWSHDGRRIAFISKRDGDVGIWILDLTRWSLQKLIGGPEIKSFPCWGRKDSAIFFTCFNLDTNGDGKVSSADRPSIWRISLLPDCSTPIQVTPNGFSAFQPAFGLDCLFFVSDKSRNFDIYYLESEEMVPDLPSASEQLEFSERIPDPYLRILAIKKVIRRFPEVKASSDAWVRLGEIYEGLGLCNLARRCYLVAIKHPAKSPKIIGLSRIRLISNASDELTSSDVEFLYKDVISDLGFVPEVVSNGWFSLGNFWLSRGRRIRAIKAYQKVVEEARGSVQSYLARLKIGDIYSVFGERGDVENWYLEVLRKGPETLKEEAIKRLQDLYVKGCKKEEEIMALRDLIVRHPQERLLAAKTKIRIALIYKEMGMKTEGIKELMEVLDGFSDLIDVVRFSMIEIGKIWFEEEEYDHALRYFSKVFRDSGDQEAQLYLKKTLVAKGERSFKARDYPVSIKCCKEAIAIDWGYLEAHRLLVKCYHRTKRLSLAEEVYKLRIKEDPADPVSHYGLGLIYSYIGGRFLKKAEHELRLAIELHPKLLYAYQTLGWVLEEIGKEARRKKGKIVGIYHEEALTLYRMALAINSEKGNSEIEADLCLNIGNCHYYLSNYSKAIEYYTRRLSIKKEFSTPEIEAIFYFNLGRSFRFLKAFEKSIFHFERALFLYKKLGNKKRIIQVLDQIGLAFQEMGEFEEAAHKFKEALSERERSGLSGNIPVSLRNIGINYFFLGEYDEAISFLKRALSKLPQREKKREKGGFLKFKKVIGLSETAGEAAFGFNIRDEQRLIFTYLGNAYCGLGEYEKGIHYFMRKLSLLRPKEPLKRAVLYTKLGCLYWRQRRDPQQAITFFLESLNLCKKHRFRQGFIINVLNLATIWYSLEEVGDQVFELLQEAKEVAEELHIKELQFAICSLTGMLRILRLEIQERPALHGSKTRTVTILQKEVNRILQFGGNFLKAEDALQEALLLARLERRVDLQALALINLATLYIVGSEYKKALGYLAQAKEISEEHDLTPNLVVIYERIGNIYKRTKIDLCLASYKRSINVLERDVLDVDQFSWCELRRLYEEVIRLLVSVGRTEEALRFFERMKEMERVYFHHDTILPQKEIDKTYLGTERFLIEEIKRLRKRRLMEPSNKKRIELSGEISRYKREYFENLEKISRQRPLLGNFIRAKGVDLGKIQNALHQDEAMLVYLLSNEEVFIWVLSKDGISFERVRLKLAELEKTTKGLLRCIRAYGNIDEKRRILYDTLISPIERYLSGKSSIGIIPDAFLNYVPFEILGKGKRTLIDDFSLFFLPSLSAYLMCKDLRNINYEDVSRLRKMGQDLMGTLDRIRDCGIIQIDFPFVPSKTRHSASYFEVGGERIGLQEFSSRRLFSSLVVINGFPCPRFKFQGMEISYLSRVFFYMHVPSILIRLFPSNEMIDTSFLADFYAKLKKDSKARALRDVQVSMLRRNGYFPGYRLYGFPGMDEEARKEYARKCLMRSLRTALGLVKSGKFKDAGYHFEEASGMLEMLARRAELERVYRALVDCFFKAGCFKKAAEYECRLLGLLRKEGKKVQEEEALQRLVVLYEKAGMIDKALSCQQEYIKRVRPSNKTQALHTLALLYERGGEYNRAIECLERALETSKKVGDEELHVEILKEKARMFYLRLNRFPEAISVLRDALEILEESDSDERLRSEIHHLLGLCWERLGFFDEALSSFHKALARVEDNGKRSEIYLSIANVLWHIGNYRGALEYCKKSKKLSELLGRQDIILLSHALKGLVYLTLGKVDDGLREERKALSIAKKLQDPMNQAACFNNLGILFREKGELDKALQNFFAALEIDERLDSSWGMAYDFRNIGIVFEMKGDYKKAMFYLKKALEISAKIKDRKNETSTLLSIGSVYEGLGDLQKALFYLNKSRDAAKRYHLKEVFWRAARRIGRIQKVRGEIASAFQHLREAIDAVEEMRASLKAESLKQGYMEGKMDLYEDMILLCLDEGWEREALHFLERAKSRNFIDMLMNRRINLSKGKHDRLLKEERMLKQEIGLFARREILEKDEEKRRVLSAQLKELRSRYQTLLTNIAEESQELASFVSVRPYSIEDVVQAIPYPATIIEYFTGKKRLAIWVIHERDIHTITLPLSRRALSAKIAKFRAAIQDMKDVRGLSKDLYESLIAPIRKYIHEKSPICIIPHGPLHYLPFSALWDGDGWLIQDFCITYAPSSTVLKYCFDKRREVRGEVLGIGDPDLEDERFALPFSQREIRCISRSFKTKVFLRKDATETTARNEMAKGYKILHFACHGVFFPENPLFSCLLLSRDKKHDGRLEAYEILGQRIETELVVLSACQTGLGRVLSGDEVIGLNRSFLYAGTPSIISTLWMVDDVAQAVLLKKFYRYLKHENSPSRALRKAKISTMRFFPHPASWAGLCLTGAF